MDIKKLIQKELDSVELTKYGEVVKPEDMNDEDRVAQKEMIQNISIGSDLGIMIMEEIIETILNKPKL